MGNIFTSSCIKNRVRQNGHTVCTISPTKQYAEQGTWVSKTLTMECTSADVIIYKFSEKEKHGSESTREMGKILRESCFSFIFSTRTEVFFW